MYIKVITDDTVLDVMDSIVYVKYQDRNKTIAICPKEDAYGILSSDTSKVWHVDGMKEFPTSDYETVKLEEIDEDEYLELKKALEIKNANSSNEPVKDNYIGNDVTLDFLKSAKIEEMSKDCNAAIINGFDVRLSDSKIYHFDMTLEDQINISSLDAQIKAGAKEVPYHARGELCRMYSAEDIQAILIEGANFKIYHITYFNSLKNYINSLNRKEDVRDVVYGMNIPDDYKSDVLKELDRNK